MPDEKQKHSKRSGRRREFHILLSSDTFHHQKASTTSCSHPTLVDGNLQEKRLAAEEAARLAAEEARREAEGLAAKQESCFYSPRSVWVRTTKHNQTRSSPQTKSQPQPGFHLGVDLRKKIVTIVTVSGSSRC